MISPLVTPPAVAVTAPLPDALVVKVSPVMLPLVMFQVIGFPETPKGWPSWSCPLTVSSCFRLQESPAYITGREPEMVSVVSTGR